MSAFQVYKSAATSFSSRRLVGASARASASASCRRPRAAVPGARRYYSEGSAEVKEEPKPDPAASGDATSSAQAENLAKLKKKEDEVTDLTSRLRYLQADFLNLQRNSAREKEQTKDFAITRFAGDLLETVDVLALALKSVPPTALPKSSENGASSSSSSPQEKSHETYLAELYTGVEMTHRLLLQTLFKYNVKPFDPTGDAFDPNRHEALYQAPVPGKEPGTVLECQKIGYTIKDRVLRAAQVGVVQDTSS
ncbi:hypothetical protein EUX98_g3052 [Antrodiella citrinella]|uniref:GrpE protein homolog, mitochondrial n=1 Tax=Antrodiella citrinella TaxID=2447956 RepID=A0A4S4N5U8_9APHY|nr:hypothetical protein EUX98_g3052 [Antrodiella citrinella]